MAAAATLGIAEMEDFINRTGGARVVSILPYRLRALKRRRQAAPAKLVLAAPPPAPADRLSANEEDGVMAGIRHTASGRMTLTQARLTTVLAILTDRAAGRRGLLEDARLEAILVDGERDVFAGFWPQP
jgi:hypothetical protein